MNSKFSIRTNSAKKAMHIRVEKSFTPADAQNFVKDYKQKAAAIVPGDYTLELDCTAMQVVTKETVPELEACYVLYKNSGFQKVVFQIKED